MDTTDKVFAGIFIGLIGVILVAVGGYLVFRGTHKCVASHTVHVDRICTRMSYDPGDPLYWIENCVEAHEEAACDRWERDR